jgi:HD-GYP domain-containing protein (c-di-GMP phosphodiesterase class II)
MHVRRVGGSFFSHSFWRTRFKLTSQSDVDRLISSGVPYVEIDDALGCGPIEVEALQSRSEAHLVDRIGENITDHNRRQSYQLRNLVTPAKRAEYNRAVRSVARSKSVVGKLFDAARLGNDIPVAEALKLVEEIDEMFERGESMLLDVVRMKTADEYTYLHSVAVCALMLKFARYLDMPADEMRECGLAGLLHDVGKMRIPASMLHKPGSLTDEEFEVVKSHAQQGFQTLQSVPDLPVAALDVALLHHEKIDGSGYPLGLSGEQIPHIARMGAICDVYDALTSDRAYKAAWEPTKAIERMFAADGHFDEALLNAFAKSLNFLALIPMSAMDDSRAGVPLRQST